MEHLNLVQLLTGADELDGLAGDGLDGEGCAAAGVAVQLGEHDAGQVQGLVEHLGGVDRVLTNHGIHDEENLSRGDGLFHAGELSHELVVHMEPAGGIQKHDVVAVGSGVLNTGLGNLHRVAQSLLEHGHTQLSAHNLQLLDSGGTEGVAGHQKGTLAVLLLHEAGQLGAIGGLTGAVEAHQHHYRGRLGGDGQLGALAAHQGGQLLVDDLDNHLCGGEALQHVGTHSPLGDLGHKVLDDLVVDVGLQQGHADLLHGLLHVGLGETALAPQALKCVGELFG